MKVGIMGAGGVGGYFGGLLAASGKMDIHFVARGKHLQLIEEEGLKIVSNEKTMTVYVHATSEPDEIGYVDLLLFCVKAYDTEYAAKAMAPMVGPDTVILPLQNGLDHIEKLAKIYEITQIVPGTTYIESMVSSPGVIVHRGAPGKIIFGELSGEITERVKKIYNLFTSANIPIELSDRIETVLWEKFLLICAVHGVATLSRSSMGQILSFNETRELLKGLMKEVEEIARRKNISLSENIIEKSLELCETYDRAFKPSMLRDLEWKRPLEIDALNGLVVKMGKELGVPTPLNFAVYAALKLEDKKNQDPYWAWIAQKSKTSFQNLSIL